MNACRMRWPMGLGKYLTLHGALELEGKVLAETHWPAHAAGIHDLDVLVHETVDLANGIVHLDLLARESSTNGLGRGNTLLLGRLHMGKTSHIDEEISERGQILALALDDIPAELFASSDGIGLERQVIVGNLGVGALNSFEHSVGGPLNLVSDF